MYNIQVKEIICIIPTDQLISLLECKLDRLHSAQKEDSSWNYGIEELEQQIQELKQ